jgi:hypothetical protein
LPEKNLRKLLGLIACLVAARYLQTAATAAMPSGRPKGSPDHNGFRLTHPALHSVRGNRSAHRSTTAASRPVVIGRATNALGRAGIPITTTRDSPTPRTVAV